MGVSAWITAALWFTALGVSVGLLSSIRISRIWYALALLGPPIFLYGTLFGFLESFLWEPQETPHVRPDGFEGPLLGPTLGQTGNLLPLGLAVAVVATVCGVILVRLMLRRSDRDQPRPLQPATAVNTPRPPI
jgi:hypothetical protein